MVVSWHFCSTDVLGNVFNAVHLTVICVTLMATISYNAQECIPTQVVWINIEILLL